MQMAELTSSTLLVVKIATEKVQILEVFIKADLVPWIFCMNQNGID